VTAVVRLSLPGALADLVGGQRRVDITVAAEPATLADVLDRLDVDQPALARRLRDEQGALRRHVNVYVDGDDVRRAEGLATPVPAGAEVLVLPSVAGG
jgi:molybdopterin converting factor small subunit